MFERTPNKMLDKIRAGKPAYGMQSYIHNSALYEVAGWAGMDFCMIDMEHCRLNYESMVDIIRTCEMSGMTPLVRVPENSKTWIRYALESGARGVVVPHIKSGEDVRKAQEALRFPPEGRAGVCPAVRACKYAQGNWEEYMKESNKNTSLIVLFEDVEAIENVDEILAELKPGRDGYGMGNADIAHALYTDDKEPVNWRHPYCAEAQQIVVPKAKALGLFNQSMAFTPDVEGIKGSRAAGGDAIMFHPDIDLFQRTVIGLVKAGEEADKFFESQK
ncbi:MAG: hypothetical protein HUJ78_00635 [Mogibacterium sp.]|nr:hypothetical protein [Mogibacterium sp.]